MTKEINLSEILNKHLSACYIVHNIKISDKYQTHLIAAMREVAEKTLELASENVTLLEDDVDIGNEYLMEKYNTFYKDALFTISKPSILNTINQIK